MMLVTYNLTKVNDNLRISQGMAGRAQIVNITGTVEVYRGSPAASGSDKIGVLAKNETMIFADGNLWVNVSSTSTLPAVGCVVFE